MQSATSSSTECRFQCQKKSGTFQISQGRPTSSITDSAAIE